MKALLSALVLAGLASCVSIPTSQVVPIEGEYIPTTSQVAPVCVVSPHDGTFEGRAHTDSGKLVAKRIAAILQDIGMSSVVVPKAGTRPLTSCVEAGSELQLDSQIVLYEDRVTGWSGKPDRIEVRLTLSLVAQPSRSRSAVYIAQSNVLASGFLEWGNANPTSLLGAEFAELVRGLFKHK
jgi:hypothetical protein